MNHTETGRKYYELSYILSPSLSEADIAQSEEELRILLGSLDTTLDSWDSPKRRYLPYPIQKHTEGFSGALRFTMPIEKVSSLEEAMKQNKNVLRFMVLEWQKAQPRRINKLHKGPVKEEQVPTDEKALDEKLEEILAKNV